MMFVPLAFLALACTPVAEPASAGDRAAEVIAQKTRMPNRYTLKLRVETRTPTARPPLEAAWSATLYLWRDGNKFRVDHLDELFTPPRSTHVLGSRHVTCENCERDGYGIVTTILPGTTPNQHMVEFRRFGGPLGFDYSCTHFDWRYFGLSNACKCIYPRLHIAVDFPKFFKQPGVVTRTEDRGGAPCLVATVNTPKYDQSVWLSERDGFNPVFFEDMMRFGDIPEPRTTEISWQRTAGGHFYPKRVKNNTIATADGTKHATDEVITVTHADFDSPIDPAVFTLAGLGLNENQAIGLPGLDTMDCPLWRNGQVDHSYTVRKRMEELARSQSNGTGPSEAGRPIQVRYPSQGNTTLIVGIVAAVLAVVSAAAAVVVRRRRAA